MIEQDLLDLGYKPELCKIGTLYFKGPFFCRFDFQDENRVLFFHYKDDMYPINDNCLTKEDIQSEEQKFKKQQERIMDMLTGKTLDKLKSHAIHLFEEYLKGYTLYEKDEITAFSKKFSDDLDDFDKKC